MRGTTRAFANRVIVTRTTYVWNYLASVYVILFIVELWHVCTQRERLQHLLWIFFSRIRTILRKRRGVPAHRRRCVRKQHGVRMPIRNGVERKWWTMSACCQKHFDGQLHGVGAVYGEIPTFKLHRQHMPLRSGLSLRERSGSMHCYER